MTRQEQDSKAPANETTAIRMSLVLLSTLLLVVTSGCGKFWSAPDTTTTTTTVSCSTDCTTATSGDFYILDGSTTTPQIVGSSIVSGALQSISGSPWALPATPYSMAIAPNGDFMIVATTSGVFSYPLTNGVLGKAVTVSTDQAYGVAIDTTGEWLLEAIPGTSGVILSAVPINATTGAGNGTEQTSQFNVTNASLQANQIAISGDDKHVFLPLGAGGTVVVAFNPAATAGTNPLSTSGVVIPVAASSGSALSVAVSPGTTPSLFYIGETLAGSGGTTGGLRVFNYSSIGGTLTQASGSPIASGGLAPNFIQPAAAGGYVYVANGAGTASNGNITSFSIASAGTTTLTYTVASGAAVAAGVQPLGLAEDSSGQFLFQVATVGSPYFDSYTFDTTTAGQLDPQIDSTSSGGAIAIIAAP